jgi:hypothetical protein
LEYGEEELTSRRPDDVLEDAARDGIEIFGSLRELRRLISRRSAA